MILSKQSIALPLSTIWVPFELGHLVALFVSGKRLRFRTICSAIEVILAYLIREILIEVTERMGTEISHFIAIEFLSTNFASHIFNELGA